MKRIFTLLVLTIFFGLSSFSQRSYVNYDKDSRWFFGINGGATWHTRTEVDNILKGGYGFTFGRSFGMRPEKLFSWDLRLRYLHGWWGGQNTTPYLLDSASSASLPANYPSTVIQTYQDSVGSFVPNFKTQLMSGSLELALNTNRLRENTGWNFQIFGGIGVKGYNSRADLTNSAGQIYDYTGTGTSKADYLATQDGNYESYITGSDGDFYVDWMGSFGAGISYQVTPWASIGLSHKMTWTRSNDQFDLMPNDVGGINTGNNDIYHYSSAGIKFHLFGGHHGTIDTPIAEDTTDIEVFDLVDDPVVTTPPVQKPIVDIYDPGVSPYEVDYDHFTIRAYVHHVDGRNNITFKQDGNINNNFSYNATSDKFQSSVVLHPGQNIFEITGWNDAGQDYESTIIVYKKEEPTIEPPIVTITNPPYSPYTTNNNTFNFASTVLNVDSKSQIKVYFNGSYLPNFTYNTSSKALYATLNLQQGTNTVTVTATNAAGSDSKTAKIIYERPQTVQPPVVNFIVPSVDPHTTTNPQFNVTASVLNVDSKNNILVEVNGHPITNFNFNTVSKHVTFGINLLEGANVIQITGSNSAGVDQENTTIIYKKPEAPKPPIVSFVDPAIDPLTVYSNTYNVTAKVLNVNSASDIKLLINGVQSYNFTYSPSSKLMNFTTNLQLGSNVIEITGTNNVGSDMDATTIIHKRVVTQAPPIVKISYPAFDNQEFNTPNITVTASVLNVNDAANIQVWVNNNATNNFSFNPVTKILTLPISMVAGSNTVKVKGTNTAGSDDDTRIIIYKRSVVPAPPTVDFVNPPSSPHLVTSDQYQITANTTNIDSKSQISFLQNGVLIPDNQYTFTANHQILYNAQLIEGSNVFEIEVTNQDGQDDEIAIVTYKVENVPCIIPTVGYISPVPYSTVTDPNIIVDAQINNHSPETVVEMLLNGVSKGFMAYNPGTSIASLPATLNEGLNAITVIVTNNCGTNQATFTLNYVAPEAPCVDPVVTPIGTTSQVTQSDKASVSAGVTEITNANQISVTLNGSAIPFTFDAGTATVNVVDAALAIGNNTIVITATNDCGNASASFHILRKECNVPVISNPSQTTGAILDNTSMPFTVSVSNANGNEIELIVNGISQNFTFNATTGVVSTVINLNEGANSVIVSATNSCGTVTENYSYTYKAPCTPLSSTIVSPTGWGVSNNINGTVQTFTTTTSTMDITIHVNGTIESSGIAATVNGQAAQFTFDPVAGNVTLTGVNLNDGVNTIQFTFTNDCSQDRVDLEVTYNGCQPPVIDFPSIVEGAVYSTNPIAFDAIVQNSNGAGNIQLMLNGVSQNFTFNDQNNILSATLNLVDGNNAIQVIVNGCESVTKAINVVYEEPCEPISFTLMNPSSTTALVVDPNYAITMNLVGIDNPQQITVMHNDNPHPFIYDAGTQILTVDGITLTDGQNGITVTATNDCSQETIVYEIEYNGCQPPVITLGTNPNVATLAAYDFTAYVTNISNASEIVVLHNNVSIPFVFDGVNGIVTGEAILSEGSNLIKILANGCESAEAEFSVTYTIPCDPIVYSLSAPAQLTTSTANENYAITLVAQYADPNSISVTLNGSAVQFTYSNDLITTQNMTLVDGANTVVVTMSNACSNETVTYTINHDGCDAPTIDLTGNADAVNNASYNLSAHAANVSNQSELTLTLNGNSVPFTFDPQSGEIAAALQLNEGANAIVITANTCDAATATLNVTYTVPCYPVTYSLGSPTTMSSMIESDNINITLNVQHVANSQAITATANGNAVPFTFTNNVIAANNIPLVDGTNTVVFTFGNECSSETLTYTIESDQCPDPAIITVTGSSTVTDPLHTFTANIQNVTDPNDLTVSINGTVVPHTFVNGVLTAQMSLNLGSNEVIVTANGCETTSISYQVFYELPCNPITFTHQNPANNDTIYQTSNSILLQINAQNASQAGTTVTLNGNAIPFTFFGGAVNINTSALVTGNNSVVIHMTNDCSDAEAIFHIVVGTPCQPPVISFGSMANTATDSTYAINATVTNINDASELVVQLNGQTVPFNYSNGTITGSVHLNVGSNVITIEAAGCQTAVLSHTVAYSIPCNEITFGLVAPATGTVTSSDDKINIEISTQHVSNPALITATVNGTSITPVFDGQNGHVILHDVPLNSGANTIVINLANECSNAAVTYNVTYTAPPSSCGPRFNPGNSDWQFCLVTPNGTFSRDDLANNNNFTYNGPATSVFFKPIAGGGDAIVNGQPYAVQNGQYYLFQGNLTVDVSSSHPGSMGHWEICLTSDANPTFGNGNNRPTSPCEQTNTNTNSCGNGPGVTLQGDVLTIIGTDGDDQIQVSDDHPKWKVKAVYNDGASEEELWFQKSKVNTLYIDVCGGDDQVQCVPFNGDATIFGGPGDDQIQAGTGNNTIDASPGNDQVSQGQMQTYLDPIFTGINPKTASITSTTQMFPLKIQVQNVNDATGLKLYNNNVQVANFNYDMNNHILSANLKLKAGQNTVKVIGTNGPKMKTATYSIKYEPKNQTNNTVLTPTITNINPSRTTGDAATLTYTFKALVKNVSSKQDITLSLNGTNITAFTYNSAAKQVSAVLRLRDGANTVKLTGKNGTQSANRTYTINYKPKTNQSSGSTLAPTIINIAPATTNASASGMTFAFKAKVNNVSTKSAIKMTVNGQAYTAFSFTTSTHQVSAVLRLKTGANTIKLEANNAGKKVERTYTITYKSKDTNNSGTTTTGNTVKPVITSVNPRGSSATVTSATYMFKAKVSNVSSKANIVLKINGKTFTGFSYSSASGSITAVLRLQQGRNTISLKAVNGSQSDSKTYSVTYTPRTTTNTNTNTGGSRPTTTGGGTKTNNNGSTKTNTGGGTKTNTGGGTKTNTGGTTKTNTGGTKTTTGGGTKTTTGGGTKTTTGGSSKTTNGGSRRVGG